MASLDVIRTITIRAREEGIDAVAKALGVTVDKANALTDAEARLHAEMGKGVTVVRESAGGIISVSREYDRLVRQVDASANAQFKMANAQRIAGRAFAQGKIDVDQHARTLELAAQKYKLLDTSNDNIGKSFQLAGHQVQNLRYQLMDVAQSLAGGMSPLQVLMQQGGQIAGVFGPGTGLTGIMRGFAQAIPRSVAIGGIPALATAAVGFSVNREQEEQQETRRSLRGTGRGSGLSPADIERLTGSGFLGSSSGLSVSQARDIATDIAATGQGSEAGIGKALALAQRLRGELGASYDDTRKLLVGLFGDTEKTYDQLDRTFGTATDASRQFVRSLVDQGRAGGMALPAHAPEALVEMGVGLDEAGDHQLAAGVQLRGAG